MATGQTFSSGLHNRIYDAAVATPVFSNVYTEILVVRERLLNEAFKYLLSDFFENIIVSAAMNRRLAVLSSVVCFAFHQKVEADGCFSLRMVSSR